MKASTAVVLAALVMVGCASQDGPEPAAEESPTPLTKEQTTEAAYSEECGTLLADAAAVDATEETVEDIDPAIVACSSVEEFSTAAGDNPGALDGADPVTLLEDRCQHAEGPDVPNSDICQELASEG